MVVYYQLSTWRCRKHLHWFATKRYFLILLFSILLLTLLYIFEPLHQLYYQLFPHNILLSQTLYQIHIVIRNVSRKSSMYPFPLSPPIKFGILIRGGITTLSCTLFTQTAPAITQSIDYFSYICPNSAIQYFFLYL